MAKKVKKYPRYDFNECFLCACDIDTKRSRKSYYYWQYIATVMAAAFHDADDDAFFDFIGEFIERHAATIREQHPNLVYFSDDNFYLFTDEEIDAAFESLKKKSN